MAKGKRFVLALLSALTVASPRASADDDKLPFEMTVVLDECDEAAFGLDRFVEFLATRASAGNLERPSASARPIRVSLAESSCRDDRASVHVVVAVGDGRIVRREFEVVAIGDSSDERAERLADATHATLLAAWPSLLAAAANPYFVAGSLPVAAPVDSAILPELAPNPYRYVARSTLAVRTDELTANPYRPSSADAPTTNPYRH